MNIVKMISELRAERDHIEQMIEVLQRMAAGQGRRPGRSPAWVTEKKRAGRPKGSKNKSKIRG
jgi:hypothetical protein